ncbi:MAG: DMT family transporter, partial [Rhodospirillaceae bacterium]|nr:DMT family transporter [Rhodospirillaceae bacterium]
PNEAALLKQGGPGVLWRAALYMVVASALFATMNALAKYLLLANTGQPIGALQMTFGRYFFGTLFLLPVLFGAKVVPRTKHPFKYMFRASFGVAGVALMFLAIAVIPLANATAIGFSSPIFAMIFAVLLLGERSGPYRWLAAAVGFMGVIVIAGPDASIFGAASLFAVAAAVCMGGEIAAVKWLSGLGDRALIMLFFGNLFGAILGGLAAIPAWVSPQPMEWLIFAAMGLVAIAGQRLVLHAMAMADANFVAPFLYSTLLFSGLFGVLLFDEVLRPSLFLGMALIVGSGLLLARFGR